MWCLTPQSSFVAFAEEITAPEAETAIEATIEEAVPSEEIEVPAAEIEAPAAEIEEAAPAEEITVPAEKKEPVEIIESEIQSVQFDPSGACAKELNVSDIASPHNYPANALLNWEVSSPGADSIYITFDGKTSVENNYDFIILRQKDGTEAILTGTYLANKTITFEGDTAYIYLQSDGSNSDYGFALTSAYAFYNDHRFKITGTRAASGKRYAKVKCTRCGMVDELYLAPEVTTSASTSATVKWSAFPGTGVNYEIYRSTSSSGTFDLIKTVKDTTIYKDNTAIPGKTYYYYIIAKPAAGGSHKTETVSVTVKKLSTPKITVTSYSDCACIMYGKVSRATGYEIYYSTSKTGTYSLLKRTSDLEFDHDANVVFQKDCYYKVRAFRTISGTRYYGSFCSPVMEEVKPSISKTSLTVYEKVTATLKVEGGTGDITWASSDKTIATVNSKGTVTGKKAGTATITATRNGLKMTCKVTVKKNSKSYTVDFNLGTYEYGVVTVVPSKIYYSGDKIVEEVYFFNITDYYAGELENFTIKAYDYNGDLIAQKTVKSMDLDIQAYDYKKVKFTFSGSQVKKSNARIYKGVDLSHSGDVVFYRYTY